MKIIEKIERELSEHRQLTLQDLYELIPEHSEASIRGCINRYLINEAQPSFKRISKGTYAVVEIVSCKEVDGQHYVSYSVSYYENDKEKHIYHKDYVSDISLPEGIYSNYTDFSTLEDMEKHRQSIVGIFESGDVRDVLKHYKDESFHLLVTDPPYRTISGGSGGKNAPKGMLSKNDGKIFDNNDLSIDEWLPECYRLLKEGSHAYIFCNFLNLQKYMEAVQKVGFKIHNLLVWKKNNATPNRWYMKNCEYVLLCRKGKAKSIHDCGSMTVHEFDNIIGNKTHETEKPVDLLKMYIQNSSSVGDWVLDPFAGSGSMAEAALSLGRKFATVEIDHKYFGNIHKRICNALG